MMTEQQLTQWMMPTGRKFSGCVISALRIIIWHRMRQW